MRSPGLPTCRSSSIDALPTPSNGTLWPIRRSSWEAFCWARNASTPRPERQFVWINQSLEAKHYANTQASFTYTHDSWEEITRERDQRFPQYDIVGWYHTHPNFGIFLSHHDLFIHHNFFSQALQVAYVVDPINQTRGFFHWRDGGMAQVAGYYLTADRGDRIALARMANDLEQIPNTEGGSGGSFSPRLEAELIKMLTRPGQRDITSPAEKLQFATLYGTLGIFLGVVGLATVLWLSQLLGKIQAQNESLQKLAQIVQDSAARERVVNDGLMERSGINDPADFAGLYEKALRSRDEAEKRLETERVQREALGTQLKDKKIENLDLIETLAKAKTKLEKSEKEAKELGEMRKRVAELEKVQEKLDELEPWLTSDPGEAAQAMKKDLAFTRMVAWFGWGCTVLFGVALAASYFLLKPLPVPTAPALDDTERPTHRIE